MDPENPVVKLCVRGMEAEAEGRHTDARDLFAQAWAAAGDDFEACIAAHYMARHAGTPQDTHRWNAEALRRADAVADERVAGFRPSLYLNLGRSLEDLGDAEGAGRYYALAAEGVDGLPAGRYAEVVRNGVAAARQRTTASAQASSSSSWPRSAARISLTA